MSGPENGEPKTDSQETKTAEQQILDSILSMNAENIKSKNSKKTKAPVDQNITIEDDTITKAVKLINSHDC